VTRGREIALALVATVVALVGVEIVLRVVTPDERTCFEHDPLLGWTHKLYCVGRLRREEFDTVVRTNGQRMRESEDFGPHAGRYRVAVIGDSFVWGHGIDEEDRFTELLAARLGPAYEVLNFGVAGFGTDQYLLQIERDVLPMQPDLLLVVFFVNDLEDIMAATNHRGVPKPRFALRDGRPELTGVPVPRIAGWDDPPRARARTRIGQLFAALWPARPSQFYNPAHIALLRRDKAEVLEQALALNALLFERIADLARAARVTLVLTEVPFKEQFASDDALRASFGVVREELLLDRPAQSLAETGRRLGVHHLDTYPYIEGHGGLDNYYVGDQHLNRRGHAAMAAVLDAALREARRSRAGPGRS